MQRDAVRCSETQRNVVLSRFGAGSSYEKYAIRLMIRSTVIEKASQNSTAESGAREL